MVVDDEIFLQKALKKFFNNYQITTDTANNGKDALENVINRFINNKCCS